MKKLIALIVIIFALLTYTVGAWADTEIANDNFNRSNETPLSNSGKWTTTPGWTALNLSSNRVVGSGASLNGSLWTGDSFNDNQYATAVIQAEGVTNTGIWLRASGSSSVTGYIMVLASTTKIQFFKYVNGTGSQVSTDQTVSTMASGHTMRFEAVTSGSSVVLTCKYDGNQTCTVTDSSSIINSGSPGLYILGTTRYWDTFTAGNLAAVAPSVTTQATDTITNTGAKLHGTITNAGGGTISSNGFYLSTTNNPPTASDTVVHSDTEPDASGAYVSTLTGLTASTRYFAVAWATNEAGTTVGSSAVVFQTTPHKIYVKAAGNNTYDGYTDATAVATLAQAMTNLNAFTTKAGATVYLNKGDTWYEQLALASSGTAGNPITVTSYGTGNKPVLFRAIGGLSWAGGPIYTASLSGGCNAVIEDNVSLPLASDATLANGSWYYNAGTTTLYYTPTSGAPGDHAVYAIRDVDVSVWFATGGGSYTTIDGLKFYGYGFGNASTVPIASVTITNCDFSNCYRGIYITTPTATDCLANINYNTFDYCGSNVYLVSNGKGRWSGDLSHNTITHSNQPGYNSSTQDCKLGDTEGLSIQNPYNLTVSYNNISGGAHGATGGGGITNYIDSGVVVGPCTGNLYFNNYIHDYNCSGFISGTGNGGENSFKAYNNIISNCGTQAGGPWGGFKLNSEQEHTFSLIANNTVRGCDVGIYFNSLTDYYKLENNIIDECTYAVRSNVVIGNSVFDYNCYHHSSNLKFYYGGADRNYAYWIGTVTSETHSTNADPLFINAGGSYALATDFKLQFTSPCINAGDNTLTSTVTTDYEGTTRPK